MPAFKFKLPGRSRVGHPSASDGDERRGAGEPLPPVLVVEGTPDPSLGEVIDGTAQRLHAVVCIVDHLKDLARDPDLASVIGVVLSLPRAPGDWNHAIADARAIVGPVPVAVLAPQPTSLTLEAALPVDPAFVAPPVTVDRLLFALGAGSDTRG